MEVGSRNAERDVKKYHEAGSKKIPRRCRGFNQYWDK